MMKTIDKNKDNNSLDELVEKLKNEDSIYANLGKALTVIYWILIPVYLLLTFIKYNDLKNVGVLVSGACFILAFLIFLIYLKRYYKEYKYVDYSLPTIQMLKKAALRYHPFRLRSLWTILALVLMDAGLTLDWMEEGISTLLIQIFFWGIIIIAVIIGLIIWYIRYKPMRDKILQILKEINGE